MAPIPKPKSKKPNKRRVWMKLRDAYLARYQVDDGWWLCAHCGRLTDAPELDHIIKRSVRPDLVFVESNFQILCHLCHLKKDSGLRYT